MRVLRCAVDGFYGGSVMRKVFGLCLCLALVAFLMPVVQAGEEEVTIEQVPEPIKGLIVSLGEIGEVKEIEKETEEDGEVEYEVELVKDGVEFELSIEVEEEEEEDGEEKITMEDLPAPVRAVVSKFAANGEIEELEKETEGGIVVYEAEIEIGDVEIEIEMDADGNVLEIEVDDDDDDDDEHEHEGDDDEEEDDD